MRMLFLAIVPALLAGGCAATNEARRAEPRKAAPTNPAREAIYTEAVTASQVVERDGLRCLQALDSYGNVVEEECVALDVAE